MFPEYFDWVIPGREYVERWDVRNYKEYPPGDSSEETIKEFIEDAKRAERKVQYELIRGGMDRKQAINEACQWPLKDDTPMDIIRNFIGYHYMLQECAKAGVDP